MQDKKFLGLLDMLDGGGPGRAGDKFEGGPLSGLLNALGIRPLGAGRAMAESPQPMPRPTGLGAPPPSPAPTLAPPTVNAPLPGGAYGIPGAQGFERRAAAGSTGDPRAVALRNFFLTPDGMNAFRAAGITPQDTIDQMYAKLDALQRGR